MKTITTKRHKRLIELLIAHRKARKLRQEDLARAFRKQQAWAWRIESGERRVDLVEFLELAEVIEFDPHAVLSQVQAVPSERSQRPPKRMAARRKK